MMMKRGSVMSALSALGILCFSSVAAASSHREAPSISADPSADNTDVYAFVQGSNLVVVANYIGLELPEGGPNWAKFSDDVRYDIHIARGDGVLTDKLTYQFHFTTAAAAPGNPAANPPTPAPAGGLEFFSQLTGSGAFGQTYTVTLVQPGQPAAPVATGTVPWPNVGPETNAVSYKAIFGAAITDYEAFWVNGGTGGKGISAVTGGGAVFAGPRDDPFWVDLGAVFDLAQLRPIASKGTAPPRDSIAYMNVHAIVLQIPLATANGGAAPVSNPANAAAADAQTVGVWASASRRKSTIRRRNGVDSSYGPWIQVSRLGLPLINEAVIGLQDKDYFNHLTPADDVPTFAAYFLNPILVRDAQAVGFYGTGGPLATCTTNTSSPGEDQASGRTDILNAVNLTNFPAAGGHAIAIGNGTTGDVLRVDLGQASKFPNGRLLTDNVVDEELGLILCGKPTAILGAGGPQTNEVAFEATFPYLAKPWEGFSSNPRLGPSKNGQSGQPCGGTTGYTCDNGICSLTTNTCP